jgi:hypothetical protein
MKMPMTEMQIGDQTIRYDRDATVAVYESLEHGDAEECGCIFCKNFTAQRNLVYPPSFRALLEELGVDPNKEGEVFEYGPAESGCHLYGGWFYLVGELVTARERNSIPADSNQFAYWFTGNCPDAPAFHDGPLLAIEFTTQVKWVLRDTAEHGAASENVRPL